MHNNIETITEVDNKDNKGVDYRRKRVKRLKVMIVIIVIILLVLPTICCIILGVKVNNLQNQVKELADTHSQSETTYTASNYNDDWYKDGGTNLVTNVANQATTKTLQQTSLPTVLPTILPLNQPTSSPMLMTDNRVVDADITDSIKSGTDKKDTDKDDLDKTVAEEINVVSEQSSSSEEVTDSLASNTDDAQVITPETNGIYVGKKVYLTFDDGPSMYTDDILDILADYKIKATFFVIGKTDKRSKELYKRIVEEGHTLGMHSYSHKYEKIYNSVEDFDKDFTKLWKLLYDTTGYEPSIYRFPGGSDNLVNKNGMDDYVRYLNNAKIVYFDWNVLNGDATGVVYTKEQLVDNVLSGVAAKKTSIVLMHDAQNKKTTVDSLPGLLDELIEGGAQILPLNKDVPPIQMIRADTVK